MRLILCIYQPFITSYSSLVTVCITVRPVLSYHCPVCVCVPFCLSVILVYCGQTVGWIKMPLGTEVSLGLGDVVWDEDLAPPTPEQGAHQPPIFRIPLDMEVGLGRGDIVLGGSSSPHRKGHSSLPTPTPVLFSPLCSGTVAHLSSCWALVTNWNEELV